MAKRLTDKQQRFADEYLIDLNATQAAIRAGYSVKTATEQAARLLTNVKVQEYIQKRQNKLQANTGITQEKVLAELAAIGFSVSTDFAPNGIPLINAEHKTSSKIKALELIGKHIGMFEQKNEGREIEDLSPLVRLLKRHDKDTDD